MDSALLEAVKSYLGITWEQSAEEKKALEGIIARGQRYLDHVAGAPQNYDVEDKPRELLLEYCRYVRSNALDEFQKNYLPEFLTLQFMEAANDTEKDSGV